MSQNEEDRLIVECLRTRTEAMRKATLLSDHLRNLGTRLKVIAEQLSPYDGKEPDWVE